jgi:hypothetical protein
MRPVLSLRASKQPCRPCLSPPMLRHRRDGGKVLLRALDGTEEQLIIL